LSESNDQYFVRGDLDKVQYASSLLGSWKENVDESLRKTYMTHHNQWASELVKSKSECVRDWELFKTEIQDMYRDRDRRLDASTFALLELAQGALDPNETLKAYSNRRRTNWRRAEWDTGSPGVQTVRYEAVWAGVRPGIKA
jgi:sigma54-dependent transcription regulator